MNFKRKNLVNGYIFFMLTMLLSYMIMKNSIDENNYSVTVFLTFIVNGIIIVTQLLKSANIGYSLKDIYYLFMFIFMFIAPVVQYINDFYPPGYDNHNFSSNLILKTNFTILLFLLVFMCVNSYNERIFKKNIYKDFPVFKLKNVKLILYLGFYISLVVSIYIINNIGLTNLFARSTNSLDLESSVSLIIGKSLRAFPLIMLLINIYYRHINGKYYKKYMVVVLSILTLLTHFPTGLPRFQIAVVYLAIMLTLKQKFNNKFLFKYLLIFGLLIIFPVLNIFRSNTFSDLATLNITFPNPADEFLTSNFDSYGMLSRSILYVEEVSMTFGKQLLGSLLFFIPRKIWPSKPIGSGALLAEKLGWESTNVSMPFIGEGNINFGIIGVIFFSIILSKSISALDSKYSFTIENRYTDISFLIIVYPILIGFLFFILRGDLLSSMAYTIGYILPIVLLFILDRLVTIIFEK